MQFISDITGLDLNVSNTFELSPLGAAYFGALGMGKYSGINDLEAISNDFSTFSPKMPKLASATLYSGWKEAVSRVLD